MIDCDDSLAGVLAEPDLEPSAGVDAHVTRSAGSLQQRLADLLCQLGPVLWLERPLPRAGGTPLPGPGALCAPDLPAFGACARLDAHVTMTTAGPREWLCLCDAQARCVARLFLLPDSDCLAWDQMLDACGLVPVHGAAERRRNACDALLRSLRARGNLAWRARVLRFRMRHRSWRRELTAEAPLRLSLLGHELASHITRDEGAEWVSAFRLE